MVAGSQPVSQIFRGRGDTFLCSWREVAKGLVRGAAAAGHVMRLGADGAALAGLFCFFGSSNPLAEWRGIVGS